MIYYDNILDFRGSVDKTMDSQSGGARFESAGSDSSALGQGTLSSCLVPQKGLKAIGPLVACF